MAPVPQRGQQSPPDDARTRAGRLRGPGLVRPAWLSSFAESSAGPLSAAALLAWPRPTGALQRNWVSAGPPAARARFPRWPALPRGLCARCHRWHCCLCSDTSCLTSGGSHLSGVWVFFAFIWQTLRPRPSLLSVLYKFVHLALTATL